MSPATNVTKTKNGETSPWEKRFGAPFAGPLIPFGAEISYKSAVAEDNTSHGNKFGTSSRKGIMVGYWVNPGGKWSKDYLVFDLDTIRQNKDARRIRMRRCGEIFQKRGLPIFPVKTMEAQVTPVPSADTPLMPEVLRTDTIAAPPAPAVAPPAPPEAGPPAVAPPAAGQPAGAPPAPAAKPYVAGQFVDPSTYDASRVPQGYKCEDGRITRQNKTSSGRPEGIWPEIWAIMTAKEKREAKAAKMPPLASPATAAAALLVPKMPVLLGKTKWPHREKLREHMCQHGYALVARPVRPKEVKTNKKAIEAMQKEWASLRELSAWDEKAVQEWSEVRDAAKKAGKRINIGMVFGICVEKGSELPEGDPGRKYKGRVVFRGNDVRDESHYLATFQDLGSAPAGMSSGKFLDFLGLLPGWKLMQADAVRAYTQALLKGVPTYVRIPREQ